MHRASGFRPYKRYKPRPLTLLDVLQEDKPAHAILLLVVEQGGAVTQVDSYARESEQKQQLHAQKKDIQYANRALMFFATLTSKSVFAALRVVASNVRDDLTEFGKRHCTDFMRRYQVWDRMYKARNKGCIVDPQWTPVHEKAQPTSASAVWYLPFQSNDTTLTTLNDNLTREQRSDIAIVSDISNVLDDMNPLEADELFGTVESQFSGFYNGATEDRAEDGAILQWKIFATTRTPLTKDNVKWGECVKVVGTVDTHQRLLALLATMILCQRKAAGRCFRMASAVIRVFQLIDSSHASSSSSAVYDDRLTLRYCATLARASDASYGRVWFHLMRMAHIHEHKEAPSERSSLPVHGLACMGNTRLEAQQLYCGWRTTDGRRALPFIVALLDNVVTSTRPVRTRGFAAGLKDMVDLQFLFGARPHQKFSGNLGIAYFDDSPDKYWRRLAEVRKRGKGTREKCYLHQLSTRAEISEDDYPNLCACEEQYLLAQLEHLTAIQAAPTAASVSADVLQAKAWKKSGSGAVALAHVPPRLRASTRYS